MHLCTRIFHCQKWVSDVSTLLKSIPHVVTGKAHALTLSSDGKVELSTILGLLSLCSLIQLVHLLDIRTYKPQPGQKIPGKSAEELLSVRDVNCVPNSEQLACAYARGQALEIVNWMITTFTLDGQRWGTLASAWLRHHMMAVVNFHRYKQKEWPNDNNTIDLGQLTCQFVWYHLNIEARIVQNVMKTEMGTLAWPWDRKYIVDYSGKDYVVGAKGKYFHSYLKPAELMMSIDWMELVKKGLTEPDLAYTQHLGDLEDLQGE